MKVKDFLDYYDTTKFRIENREIYELKPSEDGLIVAAEDIGCPVCYLHEKAYDAFIKPIKDEKDTEYYDDEDMLILIRYQTHIQDAKCMPPRCPKCGHFMHTIEENVIVGGSNVYDGDENIFPSNIWKCAHCYPSKFEGYPSDYHWSETSYCLVPVPVEYNANHDIWYTGGKNYITDAELHTLLEEINEKIHAHINNYCQRVIAGERGLDNWNIDYWCDGDVEESISKFLHEAMKKF